MPVPAPNLTARSRRAAIAAEAKSRTFVGTYELHLVAQAGSWLISQLKFNLKFIDGNRELEKST
jgi:hypothetical protein